MPSNKWYLSIPELREPREKLKEWMVGYLGKCDLTDKRGALDLHEGIVECGDLNGTHKKSDEVKIELWKPVLLHPANVFLLEHNFHLHNKPSRDVFLNVTLTRPDQFYQDYVLESWRFKTARHAVSHFYLSWSVLLEQGFIKVKPKLPIHD